MRCDALRCAAMRCNALRCAAMRCDAMRCDATRCAALRCDALRCNAMRCNALQRAAKAKVPHTHTQTRQHGLRLSAVQRSAARCNRCNRCDALQPMRSDAMRCNAMRCDALRCAATRCESKSATHTHDSQRIEVIGSTQRSMLRTAAAAARARAGERRSTRLQYEWCEALPTATTARRRSLMVRMHWKTWLRQCIAMQL
jgi:hypothetical protein